MKKSTLSAIVALALVSVGLTGCDSVSSNAITIGVLPSVEAAPLYLGIDQGIFTEHDLEVNTDSFASGNAAMIKPVVSGKYGIAVSDVLTILAAIEAGEPLQMIAPAGSSSGDPASDFGGLVVNGDSAVQDLEGLEGRVIASNSLLDTNNTVLRATMDAAGADSWTVKWREVPLVDAAKALTDGTVDAAFMVEPHLTRAVNEGKRVLSYSYSEFDPSLNVNAYFTSTQFAQDNPELLKRFTEALSASVDYSNENPTKVRAIVTTYTETQWNVRLTAIMPSYTMKFNKTSLAKLAAAAVEYGVLKAEPNIGALLP